jgi:hypothetical protein
VLPENEMHIRERVKTLKEFYTNLVVYAVICIACIIIWMSTGGGFWPIWVIFALGISAIIQGLRLGIFPMIADVLPFLKPEWEEEQVKSLLDDPMTTETSSHKKSSKGKE